MLQELNRRAGEAAKVRTIIFIPSELSFVRSNFLVMHGCIKLLVSSIQPADKWSQALSGEKRQKYCLLRQQLDLKVIPFLLLSIIYWWWKLRRDILVKINTSIHKMPKSSRTTNTYECFRKSLGWFSSMSRLTQMMRDCSRMRTMISR